MADPPRPRPPVAGALLVLLVAVAACRDEERGVSGDSWECVCVLEQADGDVDAWVCALSAGEASQLATTCVADELGVATRFCDCIEAGQAFCELCQCALR